MSECNRHQVPLLPQGTRRLCLGWFCEVFSGGPRLLLSPSADLGSLLVPEILCIVDSIARFAKHWLIGQNATQSVPRQDQAENVGAILSHSTPAFRRRVTPKARTSLCLSPTGVATIDHPNIIPKRHGSFNNMATISVKRAESSSITSVEITTSAEIVSVGDGVL
jgi:hypothetical protein